MQGPKELKRPRFTLTWQHARKWVYPVTTLVQELKGLVLKLELMMKKRGTIQALGQVQATFEVLAYYALGGLLYCLIPVVCCVDPHAYPATVGDE